MSEFIDIFVIKNTGIIALNRPKALNALDLSMIKTIEIALNNFEQNENINGVLLKSAHKRGFCAGGDIRLIRQQALDGEKDKVEEFFTTEYGLNGKIAKYKKPLVVLTDGLVMGGGLGLAGHAKYRITTTKSRFAMPEAAIGFVCDCGIDAILAKIDRSTALAFLMGGEVVGAGDALALNLADCIIDENAVQRIEKNIIDIFSKEEIEGHLKDLIREENLSDLDTPFIKKTNKCKSAFNKSNAIEVFNSIKELSKDNVSAKYFYDKLKKLCPTSLAAIVISYDKARKTGDVIISLEIDLKMAPFMIFRADFAEGVRAVIVDKDKNPNWQPSNITDVNFGEIYAKLP